LPSSEHSYASLVMVPVLSVGDPRGNSVCMRIYFGGRHPGFGDLRHYEAQPRLSYRTSDHIADAGGWSARQKGDRLTLDPVLDILLICIVIGLERMLDAPAYNGRI
jgi:hypothetical protein